MYQAELKKDGSPGVWKNENQAGKDIVYTWVYRLRGYSGNIVHASKSTSKGQSNFSRPSMTQPHLVNAQTNNKRHEQEE